ncbi:MAG TPA: N-acetylneuraminate synthase family protein [Candidatus Paceibacterota bacterium]
MIIDRDIAPAVVSSEGTLRDAILKINKGGRQSVFVVSSDGVLQGVITDGDLRRWLLTQTVITPEQSLESIVNKKCRFAPVDASLESIDALFSNKIKFVPLLDAKGRLIAVARKGDQTFTIGNKKISDTSPVFIVAEIGINHNGDIAIAKKLIDKAAEAGADSAKFQMRDMDSLYRNQGNANDPSADLGTQYTLDLLSKFQLTTKEYYELFDYCKEKGLIPLCTPFDEKSVDHLEVYGMPAYKIASADLTNHALLEKIAKTGKPIICSTGMSTEAEVIKAVELFKSLGAQYALLHCNSTYPAPFKDINLKYLSRLKEIGECVVGYSGHERGMNIALAAVSMGAQIIEKHFTLDRNMEGSDHKVSLLPDELTALIHGIREIEEAKGSSGPRTITQGERMNREVLGKSLIAAEDIQEGATITEKMLAIKSPGQGLPPYRKQELIGRMANRTLKAGDVFFASDLKSANELRRSYTFKRPFGVPVRYHDADTLPKGTNVDFIEFHLSYKDLEADPATIFEKQIYDVELVTHAPDLFAGDHIMNLCSNDPLHRERSIKEMQRTINVVRNLKRFFPKTKRPLMIASVGGWTTQGFMSKEERAKGYENLLDSLSKLDMEGIELLPQTLPPFPWYQGGQQFCNLFVDPDEIADFCKRSGMRICLDISHSKLACNYYNWSLTAFVRTVGPYIAHLHIVDALGSDSEGLQIGEGDVDFLALAEELEKQAPRASFIPEIWQGHKNNGEGFWVALNRLEKWF